ncbi:Protein of unknown function [Gryllus bimaculatus]|nr:Protein of unknown function [Gryllus bimaculatus]
MVEWFGWLVWLGGAVGGGLGARRSGAWRVAAGLPDAHDYLHAQPAQRDPEAPKRTQDAALPLCVDLRRAVPPATGAQVSARHPTTTIITTNHLIRCALTVFPEPSTDLAFLRHDRRP